MPFFLILIGGFNLQFGLLILWLINQLIEIKFSCNIETPKSWLKPNPNLNTSQILSKIIGFK